MLCFSKELPTETYLLTHFREGSVCFIWQVHKMGALLKDKVNSRIYLWVCECVLRKIAGN